MPIFKLLKNREKKISRECKRKLKDAKFELAYWNLYIDHMVEVHGSKTHPEVIKAQAKYSAVKRRLMGG